MQRTRATGTRFGVLGPVEAWISGNPINVGGPREYKTLAVLLLDANRTVPVNRMIEVLWDGEPPATAGAQVRNSMSRLRRRLAAGSAAIERRPGGFRLDVAADVLDTTHFEQATAAGSRLAAAGRFDAASDAFRAAAALWRGPALSGLDCASLAAEAYRWEDRLLACLERRIECDLALGRHREVAGDLAVLAAQHPHREKLLELRVLALYRAGRRLDALAEFAAFRHRLAEVAGLAPRPELARLHHAVLRDDPALMDLAGAGFPVRPAHGRFDHGTGPHADRLLGSVHDRHPSPGDHAASGS